MVDALQPRSTVQLLLRSLLSLVLELVMAITVRFKISLPHSVSVSKPCLLEGSMDESL
jgi:hypothetical protein